MRAWSAPTVSFSGVIADSRKLAAGQLFVALRGERVDGHDYLAEVAARSAAGAVVERLLDTIVTATGGRECRACTW